MPNTRPRRLARRLTRSLAAPMLAGLLGGLAGLAGLAPVSASPVTGVAGPSCQNWTGPPPVNPGSEANELHSVAVLSGCNVWAVGSVIGPGADQALIEHWNGSSWKVMPITQPATEDFDLTAIQALSASDIWAVGRTSGTSVQTLALHWDGKSWTQTPSLNPQPTSEFTGVRVVSANDVWAVGIVAQDGENDQTLVEHWNGQAWTVAKASFPGDLLGVGATSGKDVWAVGQVFTGHRDETLILHWDGHHWVRKTSPNPGPIGNSLNSVAAISASNAWAVGFASNSTGTVSSTGVQTLILHWDGRTWARVKSPSPGGKDKDDELAGVAAISASQLVAVGTAFGSHQTIIVQWNGKSWVRTPSPERGLETQLLGVGASAPGNIWAVGDFSAGGPDQVFATRFAAPGAGAGGGAGGAGCQAVTSDQPPNPGTIDNEFTGVAALSPCDAWAVGDDDSGDQTQALIEHWGGTAWKVVPGPRLGARLSAVSSRLAGIGAVSRTDIWAVGSTGSGQKQALIERWNGQAWSVVPGPNLGGQSAELRSVSAVSAHDVWAVGFTADGSLHKTLTEHWNGSGWKVVKSPDPGQDNLLAAVAAAPDGAVWAVGQFSLTGDDDRPLLLRWTGKGWQRTTSPVRVGGIVSAVTVTSKANAWAAGTVAQAGATGAAGATVTGAGGRALILHWNGRKWALANAPAPGQSSSLDGLTAASARSAWAVGHFVARRGGGGGGGGGGSSQQTLIVHWNGTKWKQAKSPDTQDSDLLAVAASSPGNVWATGRFFLGNNSSIVVGHCC